MIGINTEINTDTILAFHLIWKFEPKSFYRYLGKSIDLDNWVSILFISIDTKLAFYSFWKLFIMSSIDTLVPDIDTFTHIVKNHKFKSAFHGQIKYHIKDAYKHTQHLHKYYSKHSKTYYISSYECLTNLPQGTITNMLSHYQTFHNVKKHILPIYNLSNSYL